MVILHGHSHFFPLLQAHLTHFLQDGAGQDSISAVSCGEHAQAGDGNDITYGNNRDNQFDGDSGNDVLQDSEGNDTLIGGAGNAPIITTHW